MTAKTNKAIEKLARAVTKAERLAEEQQHEAALKLLDDIQREAARVHIQSAYLHWLKAILLDTAPPPLTKHDEALREIQAAIALDPLSIPFRNSRRAILHNLKALMADSQRGTTDVPRLWALLVEAGDADDGVHLALARHHVAIGAPKEALNVLIALTTLSPSNSEAWLMRVEIAAKLAGSDPAVSRAEAAAAGSPCQPFGVPPVGQG